MHNFPYHATMADVTNTKFSTYLHRLMSDQGDGARSGAELARLLAVEQTSVSRWLLGGPPSLDNLRKIAPRLRVPLVDLMVEAGLVEAAEVGVGRSAAPAPLPPAVRKVLQMLDDPNIPTQFKKILLKAIDQATVIWLEMFQTPREAPARERTRAKAAR